MEIISYGGIPYTLTEKEFYKGVSKPVNRKLLRYLQPAIFLNKPDLGFRK
ncbi:MAG: hypothetical protein II818_00390 [Aeriscardovia sp.]|nr:hypothetical protein [Aeriscardovia sp.]